MLGIVLSVLGIVATFFATKWSERRKKISNFTKNEFSIGKSLRKEFPDLDLTYKYKTVINDLRVYKGILMNTGHKDRIEDVAKEISKEQLPIEKKSRMSRVCRWAFLFFYSFMFILIFFLFLLILLKGRPLDSSVYSNLDNTEISVYSESDTTYNVFAKGNVPFFDSGVSVSKADFHQNFHIEIDESSDQFSLLLILLLMALYSAILWYSCYKEITNERKSKKINSKEELLDKKR